MPGQSAQLRARLPARRRRRRPASCCGSTPSRRHRDGDRRWGRGTPLYAGDCPYAVLRPRPQFVDWEQLKGLLTFVRNLDELRILGRTAPNGTRVIVLPEQEPPTQ
ncbi:hypothetical protein [Streptomyces nojiriensis]|uniref:hypothetical protein n=1 Tax=Streptomyces nojiriensis TaxID=66374 RepID=UPI0035DA2602